MHLRDLAPSFVEQHPDPLLFVGLDGTLGAANTAAGPVLARLGLRIGDSLPRTAHEELVAGLARSGRSVVVLGDVPFAVIPASGDPSGTWLQATPSTDPLVEELRTARRAKAAFLAHASHDLRTPLNAILGYTGLLREESPKDGDLERIEIAAHQLLGLVDQLLEVSRVEAGTVGVFHETFPAQVLLDALGTLRISVTSAVDRSQTLRGDQTKIRQIVSLLVERARRAGASPRLHVERGLRFRLSLPGTPPAVVRSLLEPVGAEGLGTALAEALVHLLGGSLAAEDDALVVSTPVEERGAPLDPTQLETHGPEGATSVLVIDDDDASRDLLRRQLLRAGYRVLGVRDGELGLEVARRMRPDVVTLDIVMPRMNGWEVLRRLKDDPQTASIPVVVVSIIDAAGSGFAVGASGFLTKPIDRGRLLRTLEAFRSTVPRVLVVDDDPNHRTLVNRALARSGWTVSEAADGAEALRALESSLPDVLLLDLFMPVVDGFAVVEAVRARAEWRSLPIVVVTAMDLGPTEHARLADRVHTVVAKSGSNLERLLDEIRSVRPPRTRG